MIKETIEFDISDWTHIVNRDELSKFREELGGGEGASEGNNGNAIEIGAFPVKINYRTRSEEGKK